MGNEYSEVTTLVKEEEEEEFETLPESDEVMEEDLTHNDVGEVISVKDGMLSFQAFPL